MSKKELIEELDINGNIIGVYPKEELKKRMFLHRCSLVIPRTFENKFILSKRSKNQYPFPNTWVCCIGGKVLANETYLEGAVRESIEEVGKKLNLQEVCFFIYNKKDYKSFFTVYTTKEKLKCSQLKPNPEEIQYLKSFSLDEIEKEVLKNPKDFAPTFREAIKHFIEKLMR